MEWKGTARYQVLRCVGRGGMGIVYEALDREQNRRVALKTMLDFSPEALYQFKQEFRTLVDVHHPNLVALYELVGDADIVFFTMELVAGTTFLRFVRGDDPTPEVVEARLRHCLPQLVAGVQALHAAGKLHRDIKPSNILITEDGRLVLVDFGLAIQLPRVVDPSLRDDGIIAGTPRYIAPEQLVHEPLTPASDWYSVGAVLFEALVGQPAFPGSVPEILQAKLLEDAPTPSQRGSAVPDDLDALCRALLDREPTARPSGAELLRRVEGLKPGRVSLAPAHVQGAHLVGRELQLRALHDAFEATRAGRPTVVRITGAPGMGKSTLVQYFLDDLIERGAALVLRGRAYERESVPFKAVDGAIDELSRHLLGVRDVVPPCDAWALANMFPVLKRVPCIMALQTRPIVDPQSTRLRAFMALRAILGALEAERPIVLFVDDAQWGDADSAALLLELLRPPKAPKLLVVLSHRDEGPEGVFLSQLRGRRVEDGETRDIAVGPLEESDAVRFGLALLGSDDSESRRRAETVAREAGGSPFLVEELTRHAAGSVGTTLEQIVGERLAHLTDAARRLLETVAVAGRPLPMAVAAAAAAIDAPYETAAQAQSRRFVRLGIRDGTEVVEMIHDRIRETVVRRLSSETTREHHRSLARVLESNPRADPEAVALHLLAADERERAAKLAVRAADDAAAKLAFEQAARLYALTLTLVSDAAALQRLRLRRAEMLEWAGHGAAAAAAYLEAADGLGHVDRAEVESKAGVLLILLGRVEQGRAVTHRSLETMGVRAPRASWVALFWLLVYRALLALRGLGIDTRATADASRENFVRLEVLYDLSAGLGTIDILLASCVQAQHLLQALRTGDDLQVLRAAGFAALELAGRGGAISQRERELVRMAGDLVERCEAPEARFFFGGVQGVMLFMRGRFQEASRLLDEAEASYPNDRAGWHAITKVFAVHALTFAGELGEVAQRQAALLADAEHRGDWYTVANLAASHACYVWLAADDAELARRKVAAAMSHWETSGFMVQHWQTMIAEVEIALYEGDGARAYTRLARDQGPLRRSLLTQLQLIRAFTSFARGRAAIASISNGADRVARLAEARRMVRRLETEAMPWTNVLAHLLRGACENEAGDHEGAARALRAAAAGADDVGMLLYAAAARWRLGERETAELAMRERTVHAPRRFAAMLVPGRWEASQAVVEGQQT